MSLKMSKNDLPPIAQQHTEGEKRIKEMDTAEEESAHSELSKASV